MTWLSLILLLLALYGAYTFVKNIIRVIKELKSFDSCKIDDSYVMSDEFIQDVGNE